MFPRLRALTTAATLLLGILVPVSSRAMGGAVDHDGAEIMRPPVSSHLLVVATPVAVAIAFAGTPGPDRAPDVWRDFAPTDPSLLSLGVPATAPGAFVGPPVPMDVEWQGARTWVGVPLSFRTRPPAEAETAADRFSQGASLIASAEVTLLGLTMMMPESFTGWSEDFIADGAGNFMRAYSSPPVWDTDHWFHNYVGHPYGGNVYYNTVRCRGGGVMESFLFSASMSAMWEYGIEAVAERPSIQDLIITPIAGSLLGEFTHQLTLRMKRGGCSGFEKIAIAVLNPMNALMTGYGGPEP